MSSTPEPAVELDHVTKTFGAHIAVDGLSLTVPRGSVYGFIGPNGSGKTTTMRMILNILRPDRGRVLVMGEELRSACTDRIGYMPEERGLYRKMRVREVLEFCGELKSGTDVRREVARWLEAFGLTEWADEKVGALSKGMSQKVQFIATVVTRPELLVLDEPFTGLDPVNADLVREAILRLRDEGATVILSTHDMHVAEQMCDHVFMIFKARKVLDGTLQSIQTAHGQDTIRVRLASGAADLASVAGVGEVHRHGAVTELTLDGERDPHAIVADLVARAPVDAFEIARPSLHDIFVRIARPAPEEIRADA